MMMCIMPRAVRRCVCMLLHGRYWLFFKFLGGSITVRETAAAKYLDTPRPCQRRINPKSAIGRSCEMLMLLNLTGSTSRHHPLGNTRVPPQGRPFEI